MPNDVQTTRAAILPAQVIAHLAMEAGFEKNRRAESAAMGETVAVVAVAVALAESGGAPNAHNKTPPDNSYGLWQINMFGNLGPERLRQFGISNNEALFDPETNAKAAFQVYRDAGNTFRPWSVFTNNRYRSYLPTARAAVQNPRPYDPENDPYIPGPDPDMWSPLDAIQALGDFIGFITDPKNWLRVAAFVGGGFVLLLGIILVARETKFGKRATNAIPIARAARRMSR